MRINIFLTTFKINLKHKKTVFKLTYHKKLDKLLQLFTALNYIKCTRIVEDCIFIWPNLNPKNQWILNYKNLYRLSNKRNIKVATLKKLKQLNFTKVLILKTSRGYITNEQAIRFNTGGILFLKLG